MCNVSSIHERCVSRRRGRRVAATEDETRSKSPDLWGCSFPNGCHYSWTSAEGTYFTCQCQRDYFMLQPLAGVGSIFFFVVINVPNGASVKWILHAAHLEGWGVCSNLCSGKCSVSTMRELCLQKEKRSALNVHALHSGILSRQGSRCELKVWALAPSHVGHTLLWRI